MSPSVPLHIALVLSLVFHLAIYTAADWLGLRAPVPPRPRPVIEALLALPPVEVPPPGEELPLPETPEAVPPPSQPVLPVASPAPPAPPVPVAPPAPVTAPAAPPAVRKPPAVLAYPLEAVRRGLEGETLVLLRLDAAGTIVAVGLVRSSGHPILDSAALRAARGLKSLPDSGPNNDGELMLPVRFKLR